MNEVLGAVALLFIFPLLLASSPSLLPVPPSLPLTDKDKFCGGLSFLCWCPWGLRRHISLFRLFDDVILFPHCNRFVPNGSIYPWSTLAPFYSPLLIPRSFSLTLCLSQLTFEWFGVFFVITTKFNFALCLISVLSLLKFRFVTGFIKRVFRKV